MRYAMIAAAMMIVLATAFAYDMGNVPKFEMMDGIYGWVPPAGSVPQTEQWPAAAWVEYKGVQFVIYAKHLAAYNPATKKGKFMVWISVPPEYKRQIERIHPFGPADAGKYLRKTGFSTMTARLYKGPGDTWQSAPGYKAWTAGTDRLVIGVFQPGPGQTSPNAFALSEIWLGNGGRRAVRVTRGHFRCSCPDYTQGESKPPNENWIEWRSKRGNKRRMVDQWGLPGCSPVPGGAGGSPTPSVGQGGQGTVPATGGQGTGTPATGQGGAGGTGGQAIMPGIVAGPAGHNADPGRFTGSWADKSNGILLAIYPNGTWQMQALSEGNLPNRAGNWTIRGSHIILATRLLQPGQLWVNGMPEAAAKQLTSGRYDLTMVWDLVRNGQRLSGRLYTWRAAWDRNGKISAFKAWDHELNRSEAAAFMAAQQAFPVPNVQGGQQPTAEQIKQLQQMLEGAQH